MEVTVKEKLNIVISDDQPVVVRAHISVRDFGSEKKFVVKKPFAVNTNKLFLFTKRLTDVLLSLIAILVFLIPGIIIAIVVGASSKGPVIYSQKRLGKDGKEFDIYKFRTMIDDALLVREEVA